MRVQPTRAVSPTCGREYGLINGIPAGYESRLLHRHCTSLDLETAFKQITISKDIQLELCKECRSEKCRCPALTSETPCSSASSTPTNSSSDREDIPELVENKPLQVLYIPQQSPSDEEAD